MSTMTDEQMKRVHDITYSTHDREELAERIVALEDRVTAMYTDMHRVLVHASDTVWAGNITTLRDCMAEHMEQMSKLGIPPHDYESRKRELETGDRDWCPMQLSGVARCEGPDPALKAENDKLRKLLSNALIAAGFDGRQYLDAEHYAVALKLRCLRFGDGSHENLSRLAYAIYPCATGWSRESCEGLRDKLVDLLGGVHLID